MRGKTFVALLVRGALVWLLVAYARHMLAAENARTIPEGGALGLATVCFVLAALIAVPPFARLLGGPLGGIFASGLFYPEGRFYEPPADLLRRLRLMLYDGQIGAAEHQLHGLQNNYPPHPVVCHLLALAMALRGESPSRMLAEAKSKLWPHQRAELFRLLQRDPLPSPQESEWQESAHVPGFYERTTEMPVPERPAPMKYERTPPASDDAPVMQSAPKLKLRLVRSRPPEQPPGVAGK